MKCLLWETSCVPWGVGLAELTAHETTLCHYTQDNGARTLAGSFIAAADKTLHQAGYALRDIEGIAASLGPGSWTGLRIGLTAAKTLALSLQIPLLGVPTFDIVAQTLRRQFPAEKNALLLVQAPCRPGERYAKLWHLKDGECRLLEREWIATPEQLAQRLLAAQGGAARVITASPDGETLELPPLDIAVEAAKSTFEERMQAFAELVAARVGSAWDDALTLQPIYLAPSAAEREFYARRQSTETKP